MVLAKFAFWCSFWMAIVLLRLWGERINEIVSATCFYSERVGPGGASAHSLLPNDPPKVASQDNRRTLVRLKMSTGPLLVNRFLQNLAIRKNAEGGLWDVWHFMFDISPRSSLLKKINVSGVCRLRSTFYAYHLTNSPRMEFQGIYWDSKPHWEIDGNT